MGLRPNFRFAFDRKNRGAGWIELKENESFSWKTGYGFFMPPAFSRYEELMDSWPGDYFVPMRPSFLVNVPKGNYVVAVSFTGVEGAAALTVKEGRGRIVLDHAPVRAGESVRGEFAMHVCDGQLKLAWVGEGVRVDAVEITHAPMLPTLFLAGDSTVTDQPSAGYPYTGWGQAIGKFLNAGIAVDNHARSGRSSKSFIAEDRLNRVWKLIKPGDVLVVQFGHNDEKDDERGTEAFSTYKEHLTRYIEGARERGAVPVLVSAMQRRFFEEDGTVKDTHGDYIPAMEELARELEVPYINLAAKSRALLERMGDEPSKALFMWTAPGEYAGLPEGTTDNTHFSEQGALAIAALVAEGIREQDIPVLSACLR
ncbi:GDSL family lipase [Paenibacillus sp. YN15]|nr:GDSL family lipase [Paenibacillus sp. YN15]